MEPIIPASMGRRAAAKITDAVLLGWFAFYLAWACLIFMVGPTSADPQHNSATTISIMVFFLFLLLAPLCFVTLQTAFLCSWGATPGKLLWGLEVVTAEGATLGIWASLKRTLSEFPSAVVFGLGYLVAFTKPPGLTWHDRISRTEVIPAPASRLKWLDKTWSRRIVGSTAVAVLLLLGPGIMELAPRVHSWLQPEAERYFLAGIQAHTLGDYQKALESFTKAIASDPYYSLAYANRGGVYGDMGELKRQIEDCTKALQLDSTQVWGLLGRANAYRLQGHLIESLTDYSTVIHLRPDWSGLVFAYRGRGSIHFRQGSFDEAAADFRKGFEAGLGNYLGTSDFLKDEDFRATISMCELFRCEALRRMGNMAVADSEWALSQARGVHNLGGDQGQQECISKWLGD